MVPFYDYTTMTEQEVFDASLNHIRKQGCKSSELGRCLYHSGNDGSLGCAAAIFIPKESREWADSVMGSWAPGLLQRHILENYKGDVYSHDRLISAIQLAHDSADNSVSLRLFLKAFEDSMQKVAQRFNLEYSKQEQTND